MQRVHRALESRRRFLFGGLAAGVAASRLAAQPRRPPNILLILADDLGWRDVPFNGSDFMETPRLDALRREGMIFTNAYAGAANCAPSRACLLSGQYTPRHAVYAVQSTKRGPVKEMRMEPVPNEVNLDPDKITFGEAMLDHPSLARELPDTGDILIADDLRHRVIVVDRKTKKIVWQYGVTDTPGHAPGYLYYPDGFDIDVFRDWRGAAPK